MQRRLLEKLSFILKVNAYKSGQERARLITFLL